MRRRAAEWLSSALAGLGALGFLQVLQPWLGQTVSLTAASAAVCGTLGLPGVVALLLVRALCLAV